MELMVLCIISTCVLHNFCLTHDDFDEGYFGNDDDDDDDEDDDDDDNDGGDGPGIALRRRAEQKRVHIMGLLWLFNKVYMYNIIDITIYL